MHCSVPFLALASIFNIAVAEQNSSVQWTFLPLNVEPFIHIDLQVGAPTNVTTVFGVSGRFPNRAGNVTGAIEGHVTGIGAANELVPLMGDGSRTFQTNQITINTTTSTLLMNAQTVIQYANEALYGIAHITFEGDDAVYGNISYEQFVGQVTSEFYSGIASLDVFKLSPTGRVDGQPIEALLPPARA